MADVLGEANDKMLPYECFTNLAPCGTYRQNGSRPGFSLVPPPLVTLRVACSNVETFSRGVCKDHGFEFWD
jgi:hypothetical protein